MKPCDPALVAIGRMLVEDGARLRGVVTHAGESYGALGDGALAAFAEQKRAAAVAAAEALRGAGLPCPVVSVGSTPPPISPATSPASPRCGPGSMCSSTW